MAVGKVFIVGMRENTVKALGEVETEDDQQNRMGYERGGVLSKSQELSGVNNFTRRQERLRKSRNML